MRYSTVIAVVAPSAGIQSLHQNLHKSHSMETRSRRAGNTIIKLFLTATQFLMQENVLSLMKRLDKLAIQRNEPAGPVNLLLLSFKLTNFDKVKAAIGAVASNANVQQWLATRGMQYF